MADALASGLGTGTGGSGSSRKLLYASDFHFHLIFNKPVAVYVCSVDHLVML